MDSREAEAPSDALGRILALVESIAQRQEAQEARLDAVEGAHPKFVPMRTPRAERQGGYTPPEGLRARVLAKAKKAGDLTSGGYTNFSTPEYLAGLPPEYRPLFEMGDAVCLNPQAFLAGDEKVSGGHKWGEILAKVPGSVETPEGLTLFGEVVRLQYITNSWEPYYRVHFPGLTSDQYGGNFRESELLPA